HSRWVIGGGGRVPVPAAGRRAPGRRRGTQGTIGGLHRRDGSQRVVTGPPCTALCQERGPCRESASGAWPGAENLLFGVRSAGRSPRAALPVRRADVWGS